MKKYILFLGTFFLLVVGGCTSVQSLPQEKEDPFAGVYTERYLPWFDEPLVELAVRWHKRQGVSYVDEDGVCNILMEDSPTGIRQGGYSLIEPCVYQQAHASKAHFKAGSNVEVIRFFQEPRLGGALQRLKEVYGEELSFDSTQRYRLRCNGDLICASQMLRAEYFKTKNFCGVVFFDRNSIGHEIKHCFDGGFHHISGVWK